MASYVQISREELEDWLKSLPRQWSRDRRTAGVYFVHLSDFVAVKISSTIGSRDDAMGRGEASMQLSLVSLVTGKVVNRRAKDRKHFKRTTNWKKTWLDGLKHWDSVYMKAASFYDAIAAVEDRDKYKRDMMKRVEAISGWEDHDTLTSIYGDLVKGSILTAKRVSLIEKVERSGTGVATRSRGQLSEAQEAFLEKLKRLLTAVEAANDQWTTQFVRDIIARIERYKSEVRLSDKQKNLIRDKLRNYRIASGDDLGWD